MSKRALSPWIFMTSRNTFRKSGSCIVLHTRRRRGIKSVRKFEIQRRCTFLFSCDRVTKKKKEGKKKKGRAISTVARATRSTVSCWFLNQCVRGSKGEVEVA